MLASWSGFRVAVAASLPGAAAQCQPLCGQGIDVSADPGAIHSAAGVALLAWGLVLALRRRAPQC